MKDIRYDRQLRLWGEEGQSSIESTSVCLLGSSALGTEILKSLVLAGVHSVCIIDDAVIEQPDLGQNFFLTEKDIGANRAEVTLGYLKELNPSVAGESLLVSPRSLSDEDLLHILSFSVVVATNLPDHVCAPISALLYPAGVPFISARVYGLLGSVRISVKEHTVANNHDENPKPDLRLDQPFDALAEMVSEMVDFREMTTEQQRHTPYIILYFMALQIYRDVTGDSLAFPITYRQRQDLMGSLWSLRCPGEDGSLDSANFEEAKAALARSVQPTTIPAEVKSILSDVGHISPALLSSPFWLLCAGLRMFVEKNHVLPLSGVLPDMTSDSQRYTRLAKIFHEKALADAAEVYEYTQQIRNAKGCGAVITEDQCYRFCKNAAYIRVQRGTPIEAEEDYKKIITQISEIEDGNQGEPAAAVWMLLLKAADLFDKQKGRYPGTNGVPCTIDSMDLTERVKTLIKICGVDSSSVLSRISIDAVSEMCRYGGAEPHVVASLIGGIAAQEVIKLATNQYVPVNNTFFYEGHGQTSATFQL